MARWQVFGFFISSFTASMTKMKTIITSHCIAKAWKLLDIAMLDPAFPLRPRVPRQLPLENTINYSGKGKKSWWTLPNPEVIPRTATTCHQCTGNAVPAPKEGNLRTQRTSLVPSTHLVPGTLPASCPFSPSMLWSTGLLGTLLVLSLVSPSPWGL